MLLLTSPSYIHFSQLSSASRLLACSQTPRLISDGGTSATPIHELVTGQRKLWRRPREVFLHRGGWAEPWKLEFWRLARAGKSCKLAPGSCSAFKQQLSTLLFLLITELTLSDILLLRMRCRQIYIWGESLSFCASQLIFKLFLFFKCPLKSPSLVCTLSCLFFPLIYCL